MSQPDIRSAWRTLAVPLLIAGLSLLGLVLGLTGSGWRDALCTVATALPLAVFLKFWRHRRTTPVRKNP